MPKFQLAMESLNSGIYICYLQGKYSNHNKQHGHFSKSINYLKYRFNHYNKVTWLINIYLMLDFNIRDSK